MVTETELLAAVDEAFRVTGRGLARWPDPHPDRPPLDKEYSRVTNAAKWRIVGARGDAWLDALSDAGLAVVEPDVDVRSEAAPGPIISRIGERRRHCRMPDPIRAGGRRTGG